MRLPRLKTILLTPLILFAVFYCAAAIRLAFFVEPIAVHQGGPIEPRVVAILGASGTAGDGILKAALADTDVKKIHVITRRSTPRIDAGVSAGKVQVSLHQDYLDYAAVHEQIAEASTVYWAIGTSTFGVDEKTYGMIHVDFPQRFATEWMSVADEGDLSFHYISSSDISADSSAMWAREKVRAELTLFELAEGTRMKVIAYRPDYIGPTSEEAHLGQTFLYHFFAPVGAAVRAVQIGDAMLETTVRGDEYQNGAKLSTSRILRLSDAYQRRISSEN